MKKKLLTKTDIAVFTTIGLLIVIWGKILYLGFKDGSYGDEGNVLGRFHNLGDALGGLSAPFIGLISAGLVYFTIKQQIRANEIIVNTRREDNLANNLRSYQERLEDKYESLLEDYEPLDVKGRFRKIDEAIKGIESMGQIVPKSYLFNLAGRRHENVIDYCVNEFKRQEGFLVDLLSILRYADFFRNYLTKFYLDKNIGSEMKEQVVITMHELSSFVGSKLERMCSECNKFTQTMSEDHPEFQLLEDLRNAAVKVSGMDKSFSVLHHLHHT